MDNSPSRTSEPPTHPGSQHPAITPSRRAGFFSPVRIASLAAVTLTELARLKIFYFLLIFALIVIGNSAFMARLSFGEEFQMLKDVALGAMSIFTVLIAILATALLLPKDLEDRTVYTILAKPVPRYEYLLGKLCGIILLLVIATAVMTALFLAVLSIREQSAVQEAMRNTQLTAAPEALAAEINQIKTASFNWNLAPGIVIILLKACLLASFTLFVSTFATTSIFTMMITIAVYFIGHLQATAREYWLSGMDVQWWSRAFLAVIALLFPDLQAFNLADDVVTGVAIPLGLFTQTALLGCAYIAVYFVLACFLFSGREL
jgi:hypothetical protein